MSCGLPLLTTRAAAICEAPILSPTSFFPRPLPFAFAAPFAFGAESFFERENRLCRFSFSGFGSAATKSVLSPRRFGSRSESLISFFRSMATPPPP